jgi:hypothetical protein
MVANIAQKAHRGAVDIVAVVSHVGMPGSHGNEYHKTYHI